MEFTGYKVTKKKHNNNQDWCRGQTGNQIHEESAEIIKHQNTVTENLQKVVNLYVSFLLHRVRFHRHC